MIKTFFSKEQACSKEQVITSQVSPYYTPTEGIEVIAAPPYDSSFL